MFVHLHKPNVAPAVFYTEDYSWAQRAKSPTNTNVDVVRHLQEQRGKFSHHCYHLSDDTHGVVTQ